MKTAVAHPVLAPGRATTLSAAAHVLRLGAALCFIGHGAFGFITKSAWLPYFGVIGIPEAWAWQLMPLVGAVDVLAGMAILFAPARLPLVYMVTWAAWTALLRPLAGEPVFETLERAGNYGVPLAFLMLAGFPGKRWRDLVEPITPVLDDTVRVERVMQVLRWTTVLLLFGHGALGALTGKAMLAQHYAVVGLPEGTTQIVGWFEMALAATVALAPSVPLLALVAAWKLATESLFIAAGDPIWEFVERAGSYAAPVALALMLHARAGAAAHVARAGRPAYLQDDRQRNQNYVTQHEQ